MVSRAASFRLRLGSSRGFALLITLTLLAFLTLLLVGLATYTRVETTISGNAQRQAQAREHALLGLQAALQSLQRELGPDQRVSATAEAFPNRSGTARYTGVWDAAGSSPEPRTWLVSGNEKAPLAASPTTVLSTTSAPPTGVALVAAATSGTANDIVAPLVAVNTVGVPGTTGTSRIGNYAWWVADQGVKAPVAVADASTAVTYAPFTDTDLRARIRQQVALGAGAATAAAASQMEPRDSFNSGLVSGLKISSPAQFALLRNGSNAQLGLTISRQNFHAWSPNNFSVQANTREGGLRRDLSLLPSALGPTVEAWMNYSAPGYMEPPAAGGTNPPNPDYGTAPLRRRYYLRASDPVVSPVLSYFLLNFNLRTADKTGVQPLQVRTRWMFSLWNPYSSALVPENLRLEITGLPPRLRVAKTGDFGHSHVDLQAALGGGAATPVRISLPWDRTVSSGSPGDLASWLPGRVYTWTSSDYSSTTGEIPPGGFKSIFYSRTLDVPAGEPGTNVELPLPASPMVDLDDSTEGTRSYDLSGLGAQLTVKLIAAREEGDVVLATYTSPAFVDSSLTVGDVGNADAYQFGYLFRLGESVDGKAWLTTAGLDPRGSVLGADAFVPELSVAEPYNPTSYADDPKISDTNRLLDRSQTKLDVGKDTPVFEFPRGPVLSLGALQHVALPGQRPFAFGNSWGAAAGLGDAGATAAQAFDRYFFSGYTSAVTLPASGTLVLPNAGLAVLPRTTTGAAVTRAMLRPAQPIGVETARLTLQSGAFNLNSVHPAAWRAVLRGVRFVSTGPFRYLTASATTGTAADTSTTSIQDGNAQFLRFSQSAQETYATGTAVGAARADLFRKGMRTLTAAEVVSFANAITTLVRERQARSGSYGTAALSGPFRSLEEFVSPPLNEQGQPLFTDAAGNAQSLLERAIANANLNAAIPEFSSQWLTQADVLTALAPVLFPRSDTFLIRTYGEVLNPMTAAVEGKAWAEAIVQRFPDYVDPGADSAEVAPNELASPLNRAQGRRFKVISFRWLTRSDI